MKSSRLWIAPLFHYAPVNLGVALAAAVAVAVLAGALVVGDSLRGSLSDAALGRLGRVDDAIVSETFFRQEIAEDSARESDAVSRAAPVILLPGSASSAGGGAFAGRVNVLGVGEEFWTLFPDAPVARPTGYGALLNRALADELKIEIGAEFILRLQKLSDIPRESLAGRRTDTVQSLRLTVQGILPDTGVGRFGMSMTQAVPRNVWVDLSTLQGRLEQPGKANALLLERHNNGRYAQKDAGERLRKACFSHFTLADMGLTVREVGDSSTLAIESSRMLLPEAAARAVQIVAPEMKAREAPVFSYLATRISRDKSEIPYSIVTALDDSPASALRAMRLTDGMAPPELKTREILLNEWAASDLGASTGDPIRLEYLLYGSLGEMEKRETTMTLRGIVAMQGGALDRRLVPEFPGLSDSRSMADWDPPFPLDLGRIRARDEEYWVDYKTTPKAFIRLDDGQEMWRSRYGELTSIRLGSSGGAGPLERARVEAALRSRISPDDLGAQAIEIRRLSQESSLEGTDFGMLFAGLSLFVILSATILLAMLFKLGVESRAREVGLLMAVGFPRKRVRRLFLLQGLALSIAGGLIGTGLSLGYAALMLYGLHHWWIGAVSGIFLTLHASFGSLATGVVIGILAALASVSLSLRSLSRLEPRDLLVGVVAPAPYRLAWGIGARKSLAAGLLLLATGGGIIVAQPMRQGVESAGTFLMAGFALLTAFLLLFRAALRTGMGGGVRPGSVFALGRMGLASACRNPSRSLMTAGLVASAGFLVAAVGANRQADVLSSEETPPGAMGFSIIAESDIPLFHDLNDAAGREAMGAGKAQGAVKTFMFRLRPGDDLSCLNLYRPKDFRIVGAPNGFIQRGGGEFQSCLAETDEEKANPWRLLNRTFPDGAIPAIADANTVMWILHSGLGKDLETTGEGGRQVRLRLVGLLRRSVLQAEIVIAEDPFVRLFPSRGGYSFFLVETPPGEAAAELSSLESGLAQYGFDGELSGERLAEYAGVEDAYLSAFQSLGSLGLLLGVFGLAAVMMRNIDERRGELALLWAVGFRPRRIAWLVAGENVWLLVAGLGFGVTSALAALLPRLLGPAQGLPWASLAASFGIIAAAGILSSYALAIRSARRMNASMLKRE